MDTGTKAMITLFAVMAAGSTILGIGGWVVGAYVFKWVMGY